MPFSSENHDEIAAASPLDKSLDEAREVADADRGDLDREPLAPEFLDAEAIEAASDVPAPPLDKLARCEERLAYVFRDQALLRNALTHASSADHRLASNERLEFLGDAILGMVTCEMLFRKYPEFLEGDLTRIKSVVVSRQTCAKLSRVLGLDEFLFVGKGMTSSGGVPQSVMANVFEALIAAIYLDGGEQQARDFVKKYVGPEIALAVTGQIGDNYKSLLQQVAQRRFGETPSYQLIAERGPDHSKCFKVEAVLTGKSFPPAWGKNKKDAEQRAACNALSDLNGEAAPFPAEE